MGAGTSRAGLFAGFVRIFLVVVVSAFIVKIGSGVVAEWWGR